MGANGDDDGGAAWGFDEDAVEVEDDEEDYDDEFDEHGCVVVLFVHRKLIQASQYVGLTCAVSWLARDRYQPGQKENQKSRNYTRNAWREGHEGV